MILVFSVAAAITGSLALCLLFFRATRKTYPGFGHWTAGVGIIAAGYLLFGLRGIIPLWVSVLVANLAIPVGLLCQLDGIKLFLGFSTSRWPYWVVSVLLASAQAIFSFHWDSVYWRGVSTSLPMIAVQWYMAALLFRSSRSPRSLFIKAIGSLLVIGGCLVLGRIVWFALPLYSSQIWTPKSEALFFIGFVAVHLGTSFSMIMLNAERMESELLGTQKDLSHSVNSLQEALTRQKQAEESLRDSEERYRTFFDTSRDAVFMTTLDGRFIEFNEVALELLGYAKNQRDEVLGRAVSEFYAHPEERQAHASKVAELGFFKDYPVDLRRQDGTIIHTLITTVARKDPVGNIVGFQGTVRDVTDRKKDEEALRESEKRLRDVIDSTPFPVALVDTEDDEIFMWSQSAIELFGHTAPTAQEWYQIAYPDPDYRDDVVKRWKTFLAIARSSGQTVNTGEYQVTCRDGSVRTCELYAKFINAYLMVTFNDITERRLAEEELRHSEAKYRFLTEHGSDLIWTLDLDLRTTFVTPSVEKVLGFIPEERMLQDIEDQLTPECLNYARQRLLEELNMERQQGIQEGRSVLVELDYYHKDGSIVCLQTAVRFIRDEKGNPIGLHGISRDVTELKRVQEEVRKSEEKYRTVVEESFDGIFVHDGTVITFANSRLHEMLGYERGELQGLNYSVMIHPDYQDLTRSRAQARLRGETVIPRYEVTMLRKDGTPFPGEVNAKVIGFDKQRQIQVWIRDLSEQKRMERQLVEAQKMKAIGTLTGGIAHDFNNLLTVVNGYTEMVLLETPENDSRHEDLQKILQTGRNGAELVQRLLAFSKKGESNPQPSNLNRTVADSVALMKRILPKMIEIETVLGKDLSLVNADAAQVDQVLMNLCTNAGEAMPNGGKLRIETKNVTVDESYCSFHAGAKPGPHVLIEVSDTGSGMDTETMSRIFDPFFTTKGWDFNRGTGLGLSVSKGIVEQHGGWITCESEPGKGTTFRIYFPAIVEEPTAEKPVLVPTTLTGSGRILLVDDEEYVSELGKRILERAGYRVITASNGKEALEIYEKEQSSIDLVVLDLIMPQMSGENCLEELLRINRDVKVVVSTGHALDVREKLLFGAGVIGFVNKPYQMKEFVGIVREVLHSE